MDLIPDLRGFFVIFERNRQCKLGFQPFENTYGTFTLNLFSPSEQEGEFHALKGVLRLLVIFEEFADTLDPFIDREESGWIVVLGKGLMAEGSAPHHRDIRAVTVELKLVALS